MSSLLKGGGLLVTASLTSPQGPALCFPAGMWTPQPPQLVSGSLADPPEPQATLAKQACRWYCPSDLSVHGGLWPPAPAKELCPALGGPRRAPRPLPFPGAADAPHPLPLPGSFRARPPGLPHQRSSADPQGCSEPPLFSALERPEGLRGGRQPSADSSREKRLGMRPGARPAQGPSPGPAVLQAKLSEKTPPAAARCCRTAAFPTHSMNVKNLFIFVSQPLYNVFLFILSTAAILVILPTVFIADLFCESCTLMLFYVKIKSI